MNVYAAEKDMIYLKGTKGSASRNKEYIKNRDSTTPFSEASENVFHCIYPIVCFLRGMNLCIFLSCS